MLLFFFFKQKTAYEMRISDWSSDVCSSDLQAMQLGPIEVSDIPRHNAHTGLRPCGLDGPGCGNDMPVLGIAALQAIFVVIDLTAVSCGKITLQQLPLAIGRES